MADQCFMKWWHPGFAYAYSKCTHIRSVNPNISGDSLALCIWRTVFLCSCSIMNCVDSDHFCSFCHKISRDPTGLVRTWQNPRKIFCNGYIRAVQLIVKNCTCDLDSNTHTFLFLNDNDSAMSIKTVSQRECQWSLRSTLPMLMNQRVGHHHHTSDVNAFIHWHGRQQNTRCSSSTDTRDVKQVLKTFNSAFMLLLIQKEQHKRSFQPHIIISVLQTFKWQKYWDKSYSLCIKTYCQQ